MVCIRCNSVILAEIECKAGDTRKNAQLKVGEVYPWLTGCDTKNGGRPSGQNFVIEGYTVCPRCEKDSFIYVTIRRDVIEGVVEESSKIGYIPD